MTTASISELNLYYSKIREIGHHTRDCDGKKFIIINQTHWYDADKWTDETAAEDYQKKLLKTRDRAERC